MMAVFPTPGRLLLSIAVDSGILVDEETELLVSFVIKSAKYGLSSVVSNVFEVVCATELEYCLLCIEHNDVRGDDGANATIEHAQHRSCNIVMLFSITFILRIVRVLK